ncbi:MAG: DNA topoisomerase IV subunit B [Methylococcales bacterium]
MTRYDAAEIEVLDGLDPVRKRPGMYTDVSSPNHLAQEVIDNSVDEALAGFASHIKVHLYEDGSVGVSDNGRGMPVDIHPDQGVPGVELILTRLHAGAKFSNKNYRYSGGLHGVGISVVNALSNVLNVEVKRNSQRHAMSFENGDKVTELAVIGTVARKDTGTEVRFWPDAKYFDSVKIVTSRLKRLLRAKAVLLPGLMVDYRDDHTDETLNWCYQSGLSDYLLQRIGAQGSVPEQPFAGEQEDNSGIVEWSVLWHTEAPDSVAESYVNLVPTAQGGTHVNGLRTGLTEALREFCDLRNLLSRGVKLTPDDIWDQCHYVLSVKLEDPQFSGQTKERLSSRECAGLVSKVVKDAFSLWLHQHPSQGDAIAEIVIQSAQKRIRNARTVIRKKTGTGPSLPGKLADCSSSDPAQTELFLVEGDSAGGSAKQARDREFQAIMPLRGKILNTWEIEASQVMASKEVHDIAVAIGVDPGSHDLTGLRYGRVCILADADSDGAHIATLLCALFVKHFRALVRAGHVYVAMPPLFRIDVGNKVIYALDEAEKDMELKRIEREKIKGKVNVQRFKGLGEMNPSQLRETSINPDTRRLVQLTFEDEDDTLRRIDMMLAKKRAQDRKTWLQTDGNLVAID